MTDKPISPLRRRLIEDMTIRRLGPGTQHEYICHVKSFSGFPRPLGRQGHPEGCPSLAAAVGVDRNQVPTLSAGTSALRFFFRVTLKRRDLADGVVSVRASPPPRCSQP
jgi:integrase/recombinase XerD